MRLVVDCSNSLQSLNMKRDTVRAKKSTEQINKISARIKKIPETITEEEYFSSKS